VRIGRTGKRLSIGTVAIYSDADSRGLHMQAADEAVPIGEAPQQGAQPSGVFSFSGNACAAFASEFHELTYPIALVNLYSFLICC
jgi:hypothetical protein